MDPLKVFRVNPDGSFVWIGSADSLPVAHKMIKASKGDPSDEFLVYDSQRHNTYTLRVEELPPSVIH
jgi:hypothetical protein